MLGSHRGVNPSKVSGNIRTNNLQMCNFFFGLELGVFWVGRVGLFLWLWGFLFVLLLFAYLLAFSPSL